MNTTPKDALKEARTSADYEGTAVAYASIAQAEQLTRIADAIEELVDVVRSALAPKGVAFNALTETFERITGERP